ncbi:histidyl-tRNA synthase [Intrasporangium oryzae NRRL B-24470]|uniref:Histidine--tRNA ligase n=1 Tax=Intrasporangium oryzae NRRL B-24470 TaxID=1386089 RepID=W9G6M6_9MICO|nr:histidine--tRNA ligase [Intrasporangium oryzae]EWT01665.1 histidyl-tRNA synthase [Intrasporangium oryzae NRRL B-24470]
MSTPQAKVTPISGFPEFLPAERIVEQRFLDVIRETFELHGFSSIETRSIEPIERLSSQGEDADKEIYAVSRLAGGGDEEARWGLHFDMTVPFARYVLENSGKLAFPFRRYQIQKAWRGERPQEGRYREFTQADIDVVDVGQLSPHFEAEMPLVIADVFSKFPVGEFVIQVNNRKIPNGFYQGIGLTDVIGTLRIVDKLDKIGPEKVKALLVESGATPEQADQCLALAAIRTDDLSFVDRVRALGVEHPLLDEGLESLTEVIRTGMAHAPGKLVADLRIARGLDYYTGTVYETQFIGHESWGSFCSGGRYDALASDGRNTYPGVGISIGVTRILGLLIGSGLVTASRSTPAAVLVALKDDASREEAVAVATELRRRRIACEVAPSAAKFGKQIRYAERRGIPFVWFPGAGGSGDEVKDIRSGEQVPADASSWLPDPADLVPAVTRIG